MPLWEYTLKQNTAYGDSFTTSMGWGPFADLFHSSHLNDGRDCCALVTVVCSIGEQKEAVIYNNKVRCTTNVNF